MSDIQDYYESKFLEKQEEISSLKEKVKTLEQENAHLRKVNGIKLKKTTIKQSLVYANDALVKEKEKVKELETVIGAWHNIFGTTQLSHAKDRLDVSEEKVKRQEAQISSLRGGLENILPKISRIEICTCDIYSGKHYGQCPIFTVKQALSSDGSELLAVVREAIKSMEKAYQVLSPNCPKEFNVIPTVNDLERVLSRLRGLV